MKLTNTMKPAGIFSIAVALALPMCAQTRPLNWVASNGLDSPACGPRTSPCATFQRAHDYTTSGGVVRVVDAGNFGTVTINRGITIDGTGSGATIYGFVLVASSVGPRDAVTIRGLSIYAQGSTMAAINIQGGAAHLENLYIYAPAESFADGVLLTGGTLTTLTASHLTVIGPGSGIQAIATHMSVRDSVFRKCVRGILVIAGTAMIERSEFSFNSTGITADGMQGPATVRVSDSVITGNTTGLAPLNGGAIISFGTNMVEGNDTDGGPSSATSLK